MLTVEDYAKIRLAHRDGMSIREIARRYNRSRRKVREAIATPEPETYTRQKPPRAPKLGPYMERIDEILKTDEDEPPKQRHTAAQMFRRIQKEGYTGGYDQVRRYISSQRRVERETFLPLDHAPGRRVECDFGHIYVDFPGGRRQVAVLIVTWAYSYRPFAIALPTERVEAILHGMQEAFQHFGHVPKEVWWDNPKTVATAILVGRQRTLHLRYRALASHFNFEPLFCMPARGNEKPHAENRVKDLQRRWATPVPKAKDLTELNAYLLRCSDEDLQRVATGETETIGKRFEAEREHTLPLPKHAFDACIQKPRKVDKYQTVAFDKVRYSVPRRFAFQTATVKAYVHRIEVVVDGAVVARHERCYEAKRHILDPLHYLTVLQRKPAYLDHTAVFKEWKLPPVFERLREAFEARDGPHGGSRRFARVLQLLAKHPVARVSQAIERCEAAGMLSAEAIKHGSERLHLQEEPVKGDIEHVPEVRVPKPNLLNGSATRRVCLSDGFAL